MPEMINALDSEPISEPVKESQNSKEKFPISASFAIQAKESKPALTGKNFLIIVLLGVLAAFLIFVLTLNLRKNSDGSITLLSPLARTTESTEVAELLKVPNPITGELYSEKNVPPWITNRPLAVMINNHQDARPQSGLIDADLVYEMVAEGGITRYLGFFLSKTPEKIGPVRSIREYYLVLVKEMGDAEVMHIGYSPQALAAIESWPVRSLVRGGASFWRDNPNNVATEHTAYVNGVDLRKLGDNLGWGGIHEEFTSWQFKDNPNLYSTAKPATTITIDFWSKGDFSAIWKYDEATKYYLRFLGYDSAGNPISHLDRETKQQLKAKNVIVQFAAEVSIPNDEKHRLDYTLIGSGKAIIFMDGKAVDATWSKTARDERTKFYDMNGKEIQFNRGNFWIDIVPDRNVDQVVFN